MKVNVVMLARDRGKLTNQAIKSLYQNTPKELFNLTIVDDGSYQPVAFSLANATIRSVTPENMAIIRNVTSKGITGMARNLGVYWSERYWGQGDWLYLTDNDVYFKPNWIVKLLSEVQYLEPYRFRIIGGWNHPFLQPKGDGWYRGKSMQEKIGDGAKWLLTTDYESSQFMVAEHDAVAGASQLMRWETWDKYGPLAAVAPGVGQSEDWAMCQRIIKDGGRVGSVYPRVVLNCGLTNSLVEPSPGSDLMLAELLEAKKTYRDLYWE